MARLKTGMAVDEEGRVILTPLGTTTVSSPPAYERMSFCPKCGGALGPGREICRVCEIRYEEGVRGQGSGVSQSKSSRRDSAPDPRPPTPHPRLTPGASLVPLDQQLPEGEAPPAAPRRRADRENLINTSTAIEPGTRRALEAIAAERSLKLGALLREIVEQWVTQQAGAA